MCDLERSHELIYPYMSTNPLRAQIELIFVLRCTVFKIEAILIRRMYDLERSHDLICPYMSTNPLRAQIELIFALWCTVYEIQAILIFSIINQWRRP